MALEHVIQSGTATIGSQPWTQTMLWSLLFPSWALKMGSLFPTLESYLALKLSVPLWDGDDVLFVNNPGLKPCLGDWRFPLGRWGWNPSYLALKLAVPLRNGDDVLLVPDPGLDGERDELRLQVLLLLLQHQDWRTQTIKNIFNKPPMSYVLSSDWNLCSYIWLSCLVRIMLLKTQLTRDTIRSLWIRACF